MKDIDQIALYGTMMCLSIFLIASVQSVVFWMGLTSNQVSILRVTLLIPLIYSFIKTLEGMI